MSILNTKINLLIIFCFVSLIFSQTQKDSIQSFENIVVTGTKTEKSITLTPVKTEIIDKDDIERFGSFNLYQILDNIPGIRMEQQCNNCNFSIMRMGGLEGGYSKILIDGMPVYSGLAGVYGMQQIQSGLIERIEIVKGAGSALYGSDAIAGIVNIITKKPAPKPSLSVGGFIGFNPVNDETREGSVPLTANVSVSASHRKDNFTAVVSGQSNRLDEIDNNSDFATDRVKSNNLGGTANLSWYDCIGDNSKIGLTGRAIYEQRQGGSIEKDPDGNYYIDNPLSPEGPGTEHITTHRYVSAIYVEKELKTKTLLNARLNMVSHDRSATNGAAWEKLDGQNMNFSNINSDDYSDLAQISPVAFLTNEKTTVGELNVTQTLGKNNKLLAGLQVKRTDVEENINGTGWIERYFQDIGLFLQDEWDIANSFGFVAGLRYDMHKSEDKLVKSEYKKDAVNPRLSLRYKPIKSLITRFSWGMGFRLPGDFSEDAHLCASAPKIKKSGELTPEKAMSFNASIDFTKSNFKIGLGLFRTNIEDKIVLDDYSGSDNAYDLEWANAKGVAYTQGIDISAGFKKDFYDIETGWILNDAQYEKEQIDGIDESKNIMRSPLNSAHFNIGLFSNSDNNSLLSGWRLDIGLKFLGSMYIERDQSVIDEYPSENLKNIVETDPYALLNARINKSISSMGLNLYVSAENLTNQVQERMQWDIDDAAMVYAPLYGITIMTGFKKDF